MPKKYIYTQDPAHGWVRVLRSELKRLGIEKDITCYSYENGKYVYLEEDCDASTFIKAKEAKGEVFECVSKYVDKTAIRSYGSYQHPVES